MFINIRVTYSISIKLIRLLNFYTLWEELTVLKIFQNTGEVTRDCSIISCKINWKENRIAATIWYWAKIYSQANLIRFVKYSVFIITLYTIIFFSLFLIQILNEIVMNHLKYFVEIFRKEATSTKYTIEKWKIGTQFIIRFKTNVFGAINYFNTR